MPSWVGRIRSLLPTGRRISAESFAARHAVARIAIAVLVAILAVVGLLDGDSPGHVTVELLPIVAFGVFAHFARIRIVAALASSCALMVGASVLVHQTEGLIESHFLYFILLPLVALYQDWRAFLGSIGFVLISHALVGVVSPESMYNHAAAIESPITWAGVHALFLSGLVLILMVEWNFAEADQRRVESSQQQLLVAQAQLGQAHKLEAIGQLAAGVAHEINTPVQYVSDNTAFLAESFEELSGAFDQLAELARSHDSHAVDRFLETADIDFLREEIPGALEQSRDGLGRVAEIVRAMKDFSHPGSELADADLNGAIRSTATVSRNEWRYVADLDLDLEESLPTVRCHVGQIKQVVLNMIVNAAHAIGESIDEGVKGQITVSTGLNGDRVEIRIRDTGCGMTPEIQERIFEQFFTTKQVGRGTGQGLAMAHDIITGHGGEIRVASSVGAGTEFTLSLPLAPPEDPESGGRSR